jgi:SAM-dependent methyltransferase
MQRDEISLDAVGEEEVSISASADAYEARVRSQIEQYIDEPIHDLPEIFHIWSHNFIRPGLIDVFGAESVNDFYLKGAAEASADFTKSCRILSIGCGDGELEVELAKSLLDRGVEDFRFEGVDISPVLIERFGQKIVDAGLERHVFARVEDVNHVDRPDKYDLIIANHCLHHMVELERLFDFIDNALNDSGLFVTSDMIGRNGHMRWPETAAVLQAIWPLLSKKQRFHHQLLRANEERFLDYDCSGEGFEGIRAQDILPLILSKFQPYKFFAFGGFADVLVDRGFGPGFDVNNDWDREFIVAMCKLNDMMLDAGMLKPTSMMAYFSKNSRPQIHYRDRTAASAIRPVDSDPKWVQHFTV